VEAEDRERALQWAHVPLREPGRQRAEPGRHGLPLGGARQAGRPPPQLPRIDATLVTHAHYDHYNQPSVKAARAGVLLGEGLGKGLPLPQRELIAPIGSSLKDILRRGTYQALLRVGRRRRSRE
jgi:hypothetical protein